MKTRQWSLALKMEALYSSETSVSNNSTQHYYPEDEHRTLQSILYDPTVVRNKWLVLSNEMETSLVYLFYPHQVLQDRFLVTPYGTA
jgi:hypothetical protein